MYFKLDYNLKIHRYTVIISFHSSLHYFAKLLIISIALDTLQNATILFYSSILSTF